MESHLLQMRGLKRFLPATSDTPMSSHLLQMRGLKQDAPPSMATPGSSHLLQMRGLKRTSVYADDVSYRRIFYRCVD